MAGADLLPPRNRIARIKAAWDEAFRRLRSYYEGEVFTRFQVVYSAATWYQFNNPALIFPEEREMRFSTPNAQIPFDYYPSLIAKCGIIGHNFAYLADIEEYYQFHFPLFLWEQGDYVTPLQRANVRAAHFMPDALVAVTREGLRSFLKARGVEQGMGDYEDPLVTIETLGLLGMPRRDDIPTFFKEVSEAQGAAFRAFLETPYIFSFAGLAIPPALNENRAYGIRSRGVLTPVKALVGRYMNAELTDEELSTELKEAGYTTEVTVEGYRPVDSVDLRWVKLDPAMERLKHVIAAYEHKAAHSRYYCYADMADALRSIYEKEENARQSYV